MSSYLGQRELLRFAVAQTKKGEFSGKLMTFW